MTHIPYAPPELTPEEQVAADAQAADIMNDVDRRILDEIYASAQRDEMGGTFEPTSRAMNTDEALTSLGNILSEFADALRVTGSPIRTLPVPEGVPTFREYSQALDRQVRAALRVTPEMLGMLAPVSPTAPAKPLQPGAPTRVRRPLQLEDD